MLQGANYIFTCWTLLGYSSENPVITAQSQGLASLVCEALSSKRTLGRYVPVDNGITYRC